MFLKKVLFFFNAQITKAKNKTTQNRSHNAAEKMGEEEEEKKAIMQALQQEQATNLALTSILRTH